MNKQSRWHSFLEAWGSTLTGFLMSLAIQWTINWLWDLHLNALDNLTIIGIFTVASLIRQYYWRRLMEALHVRNPVSAFANAVLAERRRQIEVEGWALGHDDDHDPGELSRAGAAYALVDSWFVGKGFPRERYPECWPWVQEWWKPADVRRNLVKAAALILAEGEKFDRQRRRK